MCGKGGGRMTERLEEIKEAYRWTIDNSLVPRLSDSDTEWLINQAERALKNAQDLEDMGKQLAGEQKRVRDLEKELKETITKKNRHLREKDKKIKKLEWKSMIHERGHSDTYSRLFERNEECKLLKEKTERYEKALEEIKNEAEWMINLEGEKFRSIKNRCDEVLEEEEK